MVKMLQIMIRSGIIFKSCKAKVALAAGIFHREEVPLEAVKDHMRERGIETR